MNPAQTFEVLEKVENMIDSLHSDLQRVQRHMKDAGFQGLYQDQIGVIEARIAQLMQKADALRAKTIQQQGAGNA